LDQFEVVFVSPHEEKRQMMIFLPLIYLFETAIYSNSKGGVAKINDIFDAIQV